MLSQKKSFIFAVGLHIVLVLLLILSFEKTLVIPAADPNQANKKIIDAVMINTKTLQEEVSRLEEKEAKKRQQEQMRQKELVRKENEAKVKREKEEALALELKKQNELLKKEAEQRELEQQKQLKAQEAELKKIQQAKEQAKEQAKLEEKKAKEKAAELAKQQEIKQQEIIKHQQQENAKQQELAQQSRQAVRLKQDQITQAAMLIRNKIHQYWRQPLGLDFGGFKCKVAVKLLPTGDVLDAMVVESSGNLEFDRSTELAIRKASPLPMPADPAVAQEFRQFTFTFHPEAV